MSISWCQTLGNTTTYSGTRVDYEDCVALAKFHKDELDLERLAAHFHEMVSYDIAELRLKPNINIFLELLQEGTQND